MGDSQIILRIEVGETDRASSEKGVHDSYYIVHFRVGTTEEQQEAATERCRAFTLLEYGFGQARCYAFPIERLGDNRWGFNYGWVTPWMFPPEKKGEPTI